MLYLTVSSRGVQFLIQQPTDLLKANLTIVVPEGIHKGTNVLWWLTVTPEGRALLAKRPELLTPENLMATGPDKGTNVLWWLAVDIQKEIIQRYFNRLTSDNFIDLSTPYLSYTPNNDKQQLNMSDSLFHRFYRAKQFDLLEQALEHYIALNKETELNNLLRLNITNDEHQYIKDCIELIYARHAYKNLTLAVNLTPEDIISIATECFTHINQLSARSDSVYFKQAQELKAFLLGFLHEKNIPLKQTDDTLLSLILNGKTIVKSLPDARIYGSQIAKALALADKIEEMDNFLLNDAPVFALLTAPTGQQERNKKDSFSMPPQDEQHDAQKRKASAFFYNSSNKKNSDNPDKTNAPSIK